MSASMPSISMTLTSSRGGLSSDELPQGIKDIMAAMPWSQVICITKEHIQAEGRIWEPAIPLAGLSYQHVVLQKFYGTNVFEPTTGEITWMFLDKLGPERAKMLNSVHIHANHVFQYGKWLGIGGPVYQIGWHRQQQGKDSGRWHLHKGAVWVQMNLGNTSAARWIRLTSINDLRLVGGDYDWIVRPANLGQLPYLTLYETELWEAQRENRTRH